MRIPLLVLALIPAAGLLAGTINGLSVLTGPIISSGGNYGTPFVNNDNAVGASPNGAQLFLSVTGTAPVVFGWNQAISGGVTEYQIQLWMTNNSGVPWTGYYLELLDGAGNVITGDPLDFDFPNFDSPVNGNSGQWTATQHTAGIIGLSGSPVSGGQTMIVTFPLDIPDPGLPVRLRATPLTATPEPATWAACALGIGLLAGARRAQMRYAHRRL